MQDAFTKLFAVAGRPRGAGLLIRKETDVYYFSPKAVEIAETLTLGSWGGSTRSIGLDGLLSRYNVYGSLRFAPALPAILATRQRHSEASARDPGVETACE